MATNPKSYLAKQTKDQLIRIILEHRADIARQLKYIEDDIGIGALGNTYSVVVARIELELLQNQYERLITGKANQEGNLNNDEI